MIALVYHCGDFDGKISNAIARFYYTTVQNMQNDEVISIPFNYDDAFSYDEFADKKFDTIVFMDIVPYPYSDMAKLVQSHKHDAVIVIDHHKTTVDAPEFRGLNGSLCTSFAACELTWNFFFPHKAMPPIVSYAGRYDRWDKSDDWENVILPLQLGLRSNFCDFEKIMTQALTFSANPESALIVEGRTINKYMKASSEDHAKTYCFDGVFENLKVLVMNTCSRSSLAFVALWDENTYDMMLAFTIKADTVYISLYTTKEGVDCSKIAKAHGGGGHVQASGFTMNFKEFADFYTSLF